MRRFRLSHLTLPLANPLMINSPPHLDIHLITEAFSPEESQKHLQVLLESTPWRQEQVTLFGKTYWTPRLSAWYGDPGKCYSYSGIRMEPLPWTGTLECIKQRVETLTSRTFNSTLLNLYRSGQDSMGWHSDDEASLGPNPLIASVSFGATRRFRLRHRYCKTLEKVELSLPPGSVLIMQGTTQQYWHHAIPKTRKEVGARVNLTFRTIDPGSELIEKWGSGP